MDSLWGNEASLLLGDYLLSISFQILTRLEQIDILQCVSWSTRSIARGQMMEVSERAVQGDPEKCLQVYREKDASLLAAAAKCGAIWGGANRELQEQLMTFGEKWGVALVLKNDLQILDDTGLRYMFDRIRPKVLQTVWLLFNGIGSNVFCILLYRYFKSR